MTPAIEDFEELNKAYHEFIVVVATEFKIYKLLKMFNCFIGK